MKLGFFTQPVHPLGRDYAETLAEDRSIFILADQLGFSEAFCGEHLADEIENVPNSLMFLASLVDATTTMKLGTGVLNLPFSHPVVVATNVAMVDTMLQGRLLLGIGAGIGRADAEALEVLDEDRNAMFEEAIEHVVALWTSDPPYRLSGRYWNITTERTLWPELGLGAMVRPYQRPHPPILGASGDARSKRVASFGRRGWHLMSSDTMPANRLAEQWERYGDGCAEAAREAERDEWRVVRSIFVCEDETKARSYGKTDPRSPYRQHFEHLLTKFRRGRALAGVKRDPEMPDDEVTLDYFVDACVIAGGVNEVVEEILAVREAAGPFGTMVYAGKNWTDPVLGRRSMELMAEEVMPAVNAAIGTQELSAIRKNAVSVKG
jgi:alkanesulfonate monooxygenase SsuD/methylene tetrahydromethanopterin reductase-like flavin-dependent oxidoreductase (luciferase family)